MKVECRRWAWGKSKLEMACAQVVGVLQLELAWKIAWCIGGLLGNVGRLLQVLAWGTGECLMHGAWAVHGKTDRLQVG